MSIKELKHKLGIDDSYTKIYRQSKSSTSNKVKDNIYLQRGYNYQIDILHLPVDSFGYSKLLVVVDLADDSFDIEKLKDSENADATLKAYKKMFKRDYIEIPKASITSDGGSSFKSIFGDFLLQNGIHHKTARAGRHKMLSNVDSLCRQLGDIFNSLMNEQELKTGKRSKQWTKHIDTVREELNKIRLKKLPKDITTHDYPIFDPTIAPKKKRGLKKLLSYDIDIEKLFETNYALIKPKYKKGDLVNLLLSEPEDALGNKQSSKVFRMGDRRISKNKYKIASVFYYAGTPPYRYLLNALEGASAKEKKRVNSVSFEEGELK